MANASYISVSDFRNTYAADLDLTTPVVYSDATVSGMISAASRWVDSFTNASRGWDYETVANEEYSSTSSAHTDPDGNLIIPLVKRPLNNLSDVTAISINLGAFSSSLTLTSNNVSVLHSPYPGWDIIYPNTYLVSTGTLLSNQKLFSLRSFKYFIRASYSGGYQSIPDDIKWATSLAVRDILAKRANPDGASESRQGSMMNRFGGRSGSTDSPLITEAKLYLRNYVRVT